MFLVNILAGLNNAMASPSALLSPARTSPSRPIREPGSDHRPQKASPLVLSPVPQPMSKHVTETAEGQGSDEQEMTQHSQEASEGSENGGKPQRSNKGQRYKDFIAENGIKPFKKDRKVYASKSGAQGDSSDEKPQNVQPEYTSSQVTQITITGPEETEASQGFMLSPPPSVSKPDLFSKQHYIT